MSLARSRREQESQHHGVRPTGHPWRDRSSDLKKRWILPDVLIVGRDQESPSRRKCEIWHHLRAEFSEVTNVNGFKQVWIVRQLLASPNVPACCIAFRGVTESV